MTKPFFNFNDVAFLGDESGGGGATCLDLSVGIVYDWGDPNWIPLESFAGLIYAVAAGETAALEITTDLLIPTDIPAGYTLHHQRLNSATIDGTYSPVGGWEMDSMDPGFVSMLFTNGIETVYSKIQSYLTKPGCPSIGSEGDPIISDIFTPGNSVCPYYVAFAPNGGSYSAMLSQEVIISSSLGIPSDATFSAVVEEFNGSTWDFFSVTTPLGNGSNSYTLSVVGIFRIKATASKYLCSDTAEFISGTYTVT